MPDGTEPQRIEVSLPPDLRAPALARAEIREAMGSMSGDDRAVAVLLASEIVTNAVIHSHLSEAQTIGLLIAATPTRVRVEVIDPGPGFDPARRSPRPATPGGGGLLLVERLASRWGVARLSEAPSRFAVWFELEAGSISLSDETLAG